MFIEFGPGLPPNLRNQLTEFANVVGLPYIRGRWYHVDPKDGTPGGSGKTLKHALKGIEGSYKIDVTSGVRTDISFTNSGTADYISRVAGSWLTDGFVVGQVIKVTGSTSNDGRYTILTATALVLTLSTTDSLTTEVAGDDVEVTYQSGDDWLEGAIDRMVDGDGLILHSYGNTSAETTSYLTIPLDITTNGITIFGACAPCSVYPRSRIASKRVTTGAQTVISCQENTPLADTITRTTGSFIADGFKPGQTIHMTGTDGSTNDGYYTIDTVTALVITLIDTDDLTAEVAGSSITIVNYMPYIMDMQAQNFACYNVSMFNSDADAYSLGGLRVSGSRFSFIGCHIVGGAGCTATANEWSLELYGAACQDGDFWNCTFGSDTVERGNNANCEIKLNGTKQTARIRFHGGECQAMANGGTAHFAINSAGAEAVGRNIIFDRMKFNCYVSNLGADQASVFGGTGLTTAKLCFDNCSMFGYALYDAATGNDCCFVSSPQGVAAGGKGIVAS